MASEGSEIAHDRLHLADPNMLSKIDQLFACNIGHHINLPQIVVVGNQSSGKSSVLAGLVRLPFPRDSGLCTRFATQITFRRAKEKRVSVSIIPAKSASAEHSEKVRKWKRITLESLDESSFAAIMDEVHVVMGISVTSDGLPNTTTFSEDVLSLEVAGPDQEHFSVIDVPGIFKVPKPGVTTKEDRDTVDRMVESYVRNPRSVIVAVIPANVDTATQEILELAKKHDPTGLRTLGVLTKPDLVDEGAEPMVLDLLDGKSYQLSLGWYMLRNLGQKESENGMDRNQKEKDFFVNEVPWNRVAKDKVGVESLRIRLREILARLTRQEFPKVRIELNKLLKDSRTALHAMGAKRGSTEEQFQYLNGIATLFQEITMMALNATYCANDLFDEKPHFRLATLVVKRNEEFAMDFQNYGHRFRFVDPDTTEKSEAPPPIEPKVEQRSSTFTRGEPGHPDLEDILSDKIELEPPEKTGVLAWLKVQYQKSRGFELGTFDPSLLAMTMKAQSANWESLSSGYVSDVVVMTHNYITGLLEVICPDERVRLGLLSKLMDRFLEGYKRAFDHVKFILRIERSNNPTTQNHYFNDNLQKCRQKRMRAGLNDHAFTLHNKEGLAVMLEDVVTTKSYMSNQEHIVQDMHDILHSYYKVARKRIVDVICMQAVDHFLLSGPETPLKVLSPVLVGKLRPDELEQIAGEDELQKKKRDELLQKIADLEKGKRILV